MFGLRTEQVYTDAEWSIVGAGPAKEILTRLRTEGLRPQKKGKMWSSRCPFHHEKTGSFIISPKTGDWHCFGCGLGGGVEDFWDLHRSIEDARRVFARLTKPFWSFRKGGRVWLSR